MKKVLSVLLSLMIIATTNSVFVLSAFANEEKTKKIDGVEWTYTVSKGDATIIDADLSKYNKSTLTIPNKLGGCYVRSVERLGYDNERIKTLKIGKPLKAFSYSAIPDSLTKFVVDTDSKYLCSKNGVLYNKKMTKLIACPPKKTKSFTIPKTVKSIEPYAFSNSGISTISLPSSVKVIEYGAFNHASLKKIKIPSGVKSIGDFTFSGSKIKSVSFPKTVTSIGYGSFSFCEKLSSIDLSKSKLKSINHYAFSDCSNLSTVKLPDSITSIGTQVLSDTKYSNNKANWSNHGLYLGTYLLQLDIYDGSFKMKDSTTLVADDTFDGQYDTITIGKNLNNLQYHAFKSLSDAKAFKVSKGNKSYSAKDGVLFNAKKTELIKYPAGNERTKYTVPNTVTKIDSCAFLWANSLEKVTLSSKLKTIEEYTFGDTEITNITIPKSVESIGSNAFGWNLKTITIKGSKTKLAKDALPERKRDVREYNEETGKSEIVETIYVTIKAPKNSEAHKFAKKYNYKFKAI